MGASTTSRSRRGPHGDAVFAALADPTRRAVLRAVVDEGPVTATALTAHFPISRQGIAKHLAVLSDAGLVEASRSGRETRYVADLSRLDELTRWVDDVSRRWDTRLARLARLADQTGA